MKGVACNLEKKVFGYPQFDGSGEKLLTTYDGPYRDMLMDIRVFKLQSGAAKTLRYDGEETAILLLRGKLTFEWEGNTQLATRKDVFTDGPWALHVPCGVEVRLQTQEDDTEVIIQRTHNTTKFASQLYCPEDAPWNDVCRGKFGDTANRMVNTLFDYSTAPYSNMVLGEVLNDRGNWSGYIPHHHPQPEVYYFLFDRPEGFGASYVGEDVYKSTDGSFSAIPGGLTHPQVCAPGYRMYTCWMIRHFDDKPWDERFDDERYTWLYGWKGD